MNTQTPAQTHISHSQVSEFLVCPRKYHLHRRLGFKAAFCPSGLLFGSAIHESLSVYHQFRLQGQKATIEQLIGTFNGVWAKEGLPVKFRPGESDESMKAMAAKMLSRYLKNPGCCGEVIAVEEPFAVRLSPDLPEVWGRIDLIERTEHGGLVLTDFKTAGSKTQPDPSQLVLYREALKVLDYPGSEDVSVRYTVLLKTKQPDIVTFEPVLSSHAIERLTAMYVAVWRDIGSGCSFPHPGWQCPGCPWQGHCEHG